VISGLDIAETGGALVVQAGTALDPEGQLISSGGRVLAVVGTGDDLEQARDRAYAGIGRISLEGSFFRSDIAAAALHGERAVTS